MGKAQDIPFEVFGASYLSVVSVVRMHIGDTLRRCSRRRPCSILEHLHVLQMSMYTRLASNGHDTI